MESGSFLGSLDVGRLLDALEGVTYLTDARGVIRHIGKADWTAFAEENGASDLGPQTVLGRVIFDMIAGEEVRGAYRAMHDAVVSGARPRASFTYRCDSPDTERWMRMSIGLVHGDRDVGVLYQSQLIRAETRPSVELFSREHLIDAMRLEDVGRSIISLCSYCARVADPAAAEERRWISPTTYYAEGGSSDVRVSHGICDDCFANIVTPNIRAAA